MMVIGSAAVAVSLIVLGWTKEIVGIFLSPGDTVRVPIFTGWRRGLMRGNFLGKYLYDYPGSPGHISG
jgi:hypothetical protein